MTEALELRTRLGLRNRYLEFCQGCEFLDWTIETDEGDPPLSESISRYRCSLGRRDVPTPVGRKLDKERMMVQDHFEEHAAPEHYMCPVGAGDVGVVGEEIE